MINKKKEGDSHECREWGLPEPGNLVGRLEACQVAPVDCTRRTVEGWHPLKHRHTTINTTRDS